MSKKKKFYLAFLESLKYNYQVSIENEEQINTAFLNQYSKEIDIADAEIEAGNFISHSDVEKLFEQRRKAMQWKLNGISYRILEKESSILRVRHFHRRPFTR